MSEGVSCAMKSLKIGQRMKEGWKGCKSEIQPRREVEWSWSRRERGYLIFSSQRDVQEKQKVKLEIFLLPFCPSLALTKMSIEDSETQEQLVQRNGGCHIPGNAHVQVRRG